MAGESDYFDPRAVARLRGLKLRARHVVEGFLAGMHRGARHGYSVEFAEHRDYAPGDDVRYVDWKVFGKTDRIHVKRFEEEASLTCTLVVDTSESMSYQGPSAALSKFEYARCLAAALAYLVLRQKDRVAVVGFDEKVRFLAPPSGGRSHLRSILRALELSPGAHRTQAAAAFHELAERLHRRGVVVVFSDLFDDAEELLKGLRHLRYRRHDVVVFHVLDPAELEFPFRRWTQFCGLEHTGSIVLDPVSVRNAYRREIERFAERMSRGCRELRIDHVLARTDAPFDALLARFLADRAAIR